MAGLVIATCVGLLRLESRVRGMSKYDGVLAVEWEALPNWLRLPENRHILKSLASTIRLSPSDRRLKADLAERIGRTLAEPSLGWIEAVDRVTVRPDGIVNLRCGYRKPAAWVESGEYAYLIDGKGVRLPGRYDLTECAENALPSITGVHAAVPDVGQAWPGTDLASGLKLASLINNRPFRCDIRNISVENHEGRVAGNRPHLELITHELGSRIWWGRPPGEEFGTEIPAEQKLTLLETLHHRWGSIDLGRPYVDIRTYPDSVILPAANRSAVR